MLLPLAVFATIFTLNAVVAASVLPLSSAPRKLQDVGPSVSLPGWTFVGCYTDNVPSSRTLQEQHVVSSMMTPTLCTSFCANNFTTPLGFAGVEYSSECFCDFNIQGTATKVNDTQCDFPCAGDSTLNACGGASLISVWENTGANNGSGPVIPQNKGTVGTWSFAGCFQDAVGSNPRTLLERLDIPAGITIETCTARCGSMGYAIAGLEFGEECWCGHTFSIPSANVTAPLGECSRACEADHTEICGAASRLSVYLNQGANPEPPATSTTSVVVPTSTTSTTTIITTTSTTTSKTSTSITTTTSVTPTTTSTSTSTTTAKPTTTTTTSTSTSTSTTKSTTSSTTKTTSTTTTTVKPTSKSTSTTTTVIPTTTTTTTTSKSTSSSSSATVNPTTTTFTSNTTTPQPTTKLGQASSVAEKQYRRI
ncbi:hypothetical protein D9613_004600 [Agrocybe pediades]|uniref:WSC domain-containing protein n=1 Tax=Agrocybe pediades TaxID=84607 RepID=A0A8H4QJT8_9AGAR|nr:hypothetical protein D9613_004600 [Agrocybe pediades]